MAPSSNSRVLRAISLLIAVCLVSLPAYAKYSGGTGEPNDPCLIYTAEHLNELGAEPNDYDKHFKLMADIDLSGFSYDAALIAPDTNDATRRHDGTRFRGVFDGNGHTISHLTIEGGSYLGLFGRLQSDAEVKDLRVVDVNITSSGDLVGGLVGHNDGGAVTRCYSTGAVSGRGWVGGLVGINYGSIDISYSNSAVSGDDRIGGLIGDNRGGNITISYSTGTISGDEDVGGLVGYNSGNITTSYSTGTVRGGDRVGGLVGHDSGGRISDCYSTANVSGRERVGGLVGRSAYVTITNCYSVGRVTGMTYVGGLIGILYARNANVYSSFWDIEASGQMTSDGGMGKTTVKLQDPKSLMDAGWDFVGAPDGPGDIWAEPADGGYPILWWQLSPLPALPTFSGGTGTVYDPYLISIGDELNSIGYNPRLMGVHFKLIDDIDLTGIDFFIIGNLLYPFSGVFDGNGHAISNLTYMSTDANNVGLFGFVEGENAEIKNLGLIDPNIDAGIGRRVGSLVGWLIRGTITNCYIEGGSVSREDSIGGMVGKNDYGTIIDSFITTSVSGDYSVGGIAGYNSGTIINCYANGSVMGNGYVGGMVGYNLGTITNCCASGVVIGNKNVGGMVGRHGRYDSYYWFPDLGRDLLFPDLERTDKISNCYSTSDVSGGDRVGGLAGMQTSNSIITNCYSMGSVSGNADVGGLVGVVPYPPPGMSLWDITPDTISDFYSTPDITGTGEVGQIFRGFIPYLMNNFWDTETSGQESSAAGTGKTTAEMQTATTFLEAGWDFVDEMANGNEDIWWILEGQDYPRLWWELIAGN
ncbi:MAG: GLUG motif-containing protein [Planctomycetota bacterium]